MPPGNPDTPAELVHFTGRTRGPDQSLPHGLPTAALSRLEAIITTGILRGFRAPWTEGPVVCFSELSAVAVERQLVEGFTRRGPYEPYGVIITKLAAFQAGARPAWYLTDSEWEATNGLPLSRSFKDRRVKSEPGGPVDWTHEREWRICFDSPRGEPHWQLPVGSVAGVITDDPWIRDLSPAPAFDGVRVHVFAQDGLFPCGELGDPME